MNKEDMLTSTFGTLKPIIALLHIEALPGDPGFRKGTELGKIADNVKRDVDNLIAGGVDAILFSNEFSMPYQNCVPHAVSAAMAYIVGRVKDMLTVPFGVHVISDGMATVDLAAAVGADFVRGIFTGAYVGECGVKNTDIAAVLRRRAELGADNLKMFYMVNAEADAYLNDRPLGTIVNSMIFKSNPDGICLSGLHAGEEAEDDFLDEVRCSAGSTAVFANTGCSKDNIAEKLRHCDGAFVGTGFKAEGRFENHTDPRRVQEFMDIVRAFR